MAKVGARAVTNVVWCCSKCREHVETAQPELGCAEVWTVHRIISWWDTPGRHKRQTNLCRDAARSNSNRQLTTALWNIVAGAFAHYQTSHCCQQRPCRTGAPRGPGTQTRMHVFPVGQHLVAQREVLTRHMTLSGLPLGIVHVCRQRESDARRRNTARGGTMPLIPIVRK
jgi:hypothetical protein